MRIAHSQIIFKSINEIILFGALTWHKKYMLFYMKGLIPLPHSCHDL